MPNLPTEQSEPDRKILENWEYPNKAIGTNMYKQVQTMVPKQIPANNTTLCQGHANNTNKHVQTSANRSIRQDLRSSNPLEPVH